MPTVGENRLKQMERLTTCPICLDKFRIPKVLPCMHTFCLTPCLSNLVEPRARSLRCPECRREHQIPAGGVQSFPSNLTMVGFLDLPPPTTMTSLPDRCFICQEQKQTLIECNDCSKFLCTDCRGPHLRDTINNLSSSISQLRRSLPKLSDKIASYEQKVNSVKSNHDQIRREITQTIAALIDELKHREATLLTETEVYMQSQLRAFRIQQETAEVDLASVASFCESVGTSVSNGQLINDVDVANIRSQCNRYSQQIDTLQTQMPTDMQKLRLIFENQAVLSSSIQNFGQLIDMSSDQQQRRQSQTSTSQVVQLHQPRFSSTLNPSMSTHYITTSQNRGFIQEQFSNDRFPYLANVRSTRGSTTSQTTPYRSTQNYPSDSSNNPFADRSLTVPPRTSTSSNRTSSDSQSFNRSTSNVQSSSVFGSNPFASTAPRPAQRSSIPSLPPEPSPRRNFLTSTTAARSLEGDDRPIFGGKGGGNNVASRGRIRYGAMVPIQEHEPLTNSLERRGTFVLDEPTLPNLPQSGAQRPRDTVIVQELYNVRRRNRARTPVAFTVNLNETAQSSAS